jgi:hypothetical protein
MRRIAKGDRTAVVELADLYEATGYQTLALAVLRCASDDHAWEVLRENAQTWRS